MLLEYWIFFLVWRRWAYGWRSYTFLSGSYNIYYIIRPRNITPRYSKLPMSEQKRGAASSRTGFLNLWSFDQKGRAAGYQTKCYFTFNTVEWLNVPLWSHWSVVQTKNDKKIPKSLGIGLFNLMNSIILIEGSLP